MLPYSESESTSTHHSSIHSQEKPSTDDNSFHPVTISEIFETNASNGSCKRRLFYNTESVRSDMEISALTLSRMAQHEEEIVSL